MKYRTLIALHVAALLVAACALKEAIAADCLPHIHAYAQHAEPGYESTTPGIGIFCRDDSLIAGAGIIRNSIAQQSKYAFAGWQPLRLGQTRFGAIAGVIDGYTYRNGGAFPFAAAAISTPWTAFGRSGEIHLTLIPKVKNISPWTAGVSMTVKF